MASWSSWSNSDSSNSWDNRQQWNRWSKEDKWDSKYSEKSWEHVASPTYQSFSLPSSFVSDQQHYDKTPLGKGAHVLHKLVQPTEWSRKAGLAGRDVSDIRAFELSHRGLGDFSFRLLSEGRHQSIVWARSGQESVLITALLKKLRESGVSIDEAAKACHKSAPPDKHKEAMRFMEPLAQELLNCVLAKAPPTNSDASEELAKAKAKLAEHGIAMSPLKRKATEDPEPDSDKRAKPAMPIAEPESQMEAEQLPKDPQRKLDTRPKGATDDHVTEWLATYKNKPEFKGKYQLLVKHVQTVQKLLKTEASKDQLVSAAKDFGLDPKLASRLSIKNLSTVIAVAQFQTA
ncbi:unnamed protein product [Symbiodinium sp. CCMP2592]|nr:unnamed protein product [Symbiodinium sp. CCMP2592]